MPTSFWETWKRGTLPKGVGPPYSYNDDPRLKRATKMLRAASEQAGDCAETQAECWKWQQKDPPGECDASAHYWFNQSYKQYGLNPPGCPNVKKGGQIVKADCAKYLERYKMWHCIQKGRQLTANKCFRGGDAGHVEQIACGGKAQTRCGNVLADPICADFVASLPGGGLPTNIECPIYDDIFKPGTTQNTQCTKYGDLGRETYKECEGCPHAPKKVGSSQPCDVGD